MVPWLRVAGKMACCDGPSCCAEATEFLGDVGGTNSYSPEAEKNSGSLCVKN